MLLTCCFRDPNEAKKIKASEKTNRYRGKEEKYPPKREEKRLLKQKSQESLQKRSLTSQDRPSIPFIDHSPVDPIAAPNFATISAIHVRTQAYSRQAQHTHYSPETRRVSTFLGSCNSIHKSRDIIHKSSTLSNHSHKSSTISNHSNEFSGVPLKTRNNPDNVKPHLPPRAVLSSRNPYGKSSKSVEALSQKVPDQNLVVDESAFHRVQYQMQAEFEVKINAAKRELSDALDKEKKVHNFQLLQEMKMYRNELEMNVLNIQNDANEMILQLNNEMSVERNKLNNIHLDNTKILEDKYKLNENKLNDSLKSVKEREDIWEKEKTEILEEVQNLKSEALQMVTKLALEYEEESTGPEKRRSLSQEVFCLQIIVEMKTDEMRNLREQVAITEQQLEQSENSKKKLSTVLARIEDLEEQIAIKERVEKQLSLENSQLEISVTNTNKAAERMSQNVEELQWRINNNYDLPVHVYFERPQKDNKSLEEPKEVSSGNLSLQIDYREQMLIRSLNDVMENAEVGGKKAEVVKGDDREQTKVYCDLKKHDSDTDPTIESFDEGLGDISSESEIANSPTPNMSNNADHGDSDDDNSKRGTISHENENGGKLIKSKVKYSPNLHRGIRNNPAYNRRISIETPL